MRQTAAVTAIAPLAIITGSGWLALPPGFAGFYVWIAVWSHLRVLPADLSAIASPGS